MMDRLNCNERQKLILKRLLEEKEVSGRTLAADCEISAKTLIRDIAGLNEQLRLWNCRIVARAGHGYFLQAEQPQRLRELQRRIEYDLQHNQYLDLGRMKLSYSLLLHLLSQPAMKADELAALTHYSRSRMSGEIRHIRQIVEEYGCTLQSRPHYGFSIMGEEWNLRFLRIAMRKVCLRIRDEQQPFSQFLSQFEPEGIDRAQVMQIVRKWAFHTEGLSLPWAELPRLVDFILLACQRRAYAFRLPQDPQQKGQPAARRLCQARMLADLLAEKTAIRLNEEETLAVAALLHCCCTVQSLNEASFEEAQTAREDVACLLSRLPSDAQLQEEVACYRIEVGRRYRYQIPQDKEAVARVKEEGVRIVELCYQLGDIIEQRHGMILSEAELLAAAAPIGSAWLRHPPRRQNYRLLVVSAYGIHEARQLAERLKASCSEWICSVQALEYTQLKQADLQGVQLVISDVVHLSREMGDLPVMRLDHFGHDIQPRSLIRRINRILWKPIRQLSEMIDIQPDCDIDSASQALSRIVCRCEVEESRRGELLELCLRRERRISSERSGKTAVVLLPEGTGPQLQLLFCSRPILWRHQQVRLIAAVSLHGLSEELALRAEELIVQLMRLNTQEIDQLRQMEPLPVLRLLLRKARTASRKRMDR